jgi:hypothetical protein
MSEVFKNLSAVDCSAHIEKKNNLSYLSWAWAWAELKKNYPTATRVVYEDQNGRPYFDDGRTCWVKVGVIVEEMECIDYLPVMDFRNKSIPVDAVTSMDVNKSIQRSTVKAIALHGLGLYIYAGEDMPEPTTITAENMADIKKNYSEPQILVACQMMRVQGLAQVKTSDYIPFQQCLEDAKYNESLRTIRKRIVEAFSVLGNNAEAKNSVKKHLGVESLNDCKDLSALEDFYKHTCKKVEEKRESEAKVASV